MRMPKRLDTKIDRLCELNDAINFAQNQLSETMEYKNLQSLKADYSELENNLLTEYDAEALRNTRGKHAYLSVSKRKSYSIDDWDELYKYVVKHKAYDIFQRRVASSAVLEREEDGQTIPGLSSRVSINIKVKR